MRVCEPRRSEPLPPVEPARRLGNAACIRRILHLARRHWRAFIVAGVASAVSAGAAGLVPLTLKRLTDDSIVRLDQGAGLNVRLVLVLFGLVVAGNLCGMAGGVMMMRAQSAISAGLRMDLFRSLLDRRLAFHHQFGAGRRASWVTNDPEPMAASVPILFSLFISSPASIAALTVAMLALSWRLTLVTLVVWPLVYPLVMAVSRRARRATRDVLNVLGENMGYLHEHFSLIKEIKALGREGHAALRYGPVNEALRRILVRAGVLRLLASPLAEIASVFLICIIAVAASHWAGLIRIQPGQVIGFLVAAFMIHRPVKSLAGAAVQLSRSLESAERVFAVLDAGRAAREAAARPPLEGPIERLALEDVSFAYHDGHPILTDVRFEARRGEVVVLVGPSGVGKTTVIDLILGLYEPTAGRILVNGLDLRTINGDSVRDQTGLVTQQPLLFAGTVAENIRYGRLDADQASVVRAAQEAHLHDQILNLPQGYETRLGEGGVGLSVGQRQRLALARALIRRPSLLLLDEVTSGLDSDLEREIVAQVGRLAADLIVIVATHRPAAWGMAHRAVILKAGEAPPAVDAGKTGGGCRVPGAGLKEADPGFPTPGTRNPEPGLPGPTS